MSHIFAHEIEIIIIMYLVNYMLKTFVLSLQQSWDG